MKDFEHHIGTKHFRLVRTCARLGPVRARKALHSREKFAVPDSRKIRWKRHFVVSWIIIIIRDFLYINPLWLIYDSDHSTSKLSKYKLFSFIHVTLIPTIHSPEYWLNATFHVLPDPVLTQDFCYVLYYSLWEVRSMHTRFSTIHDFYLWQFSPTTLRLNLFFNLLEMKRSVWNK